MTYPKINYIGNKRKISDWLISNMPVTHGVVLDLFAGGCSMSYAFKQAGYSVLSNDVLYSSHLISKAIIENSSIKLPASKIIRSPKTADSAHIRSLLEDKLYFSSEMDELEELISTANSLVEYERAIFLSLLRRSMIRKLPYSRMNVPWNQIQKLRDEDYSYKKYGRKRAYHNEPFINHMVSNIDEYNDSIFDNGHSCQSFNCDALELAKHVQKVDILYLDPPYPSTMNNYDAFYGLFDEVFHKKAPSHLDLTNKNTFLQNIEKILQTYRDKTQFVVLSQNTKSKPGRTEISNLLRQYGTLEVLETNHNYQVTGKDNKSSSQELAYILKISA